MGKGEWMDGRKTGGFAAGCLTAVVVLVVLALAFCVLMGVVFSGCVKAMTDGCGREALAELDAGGNSPEGADSFRKIWTLGDGGTNAVRVVRVKIRGPIVEHASRSIFELDEATGASAALRQIRAATDDGDVDGLWLDVDSPGGSVTLSDEIHDAVRKFQASDSNRFVFAQMGDLCCSGGYYALASADVVMARPTTLTGSIGVVMFGVNAARLAQTLGVESVTIASAGNKDLLNPLKPVDPRHVEILRRPILQMYERFVDVVAKGRRLAPKRVRELADGRVYSAQDALENGLVDAIGHEEEAFDAVCDLAGTDDVRVYRYREKPNLGRLLGTSFLFESSGDLARAFKAALDEAIVPRAEFR